MDIIQVDSITNYNREHYKEGYNDAKEEAINIIIDYIDEISLEDISTNSPKSPELDILQKIVEDLYKMKVYYEKY